MRIRVLFLGFLLIAAVGYAGILDEAMSGVGEGPYAVLRTRFEVTFMKIDVADVEVRVSQATSRDLRALVEGKQHSDAVSDRIAERILNADTLLNRMHYLRDGGFGKFKKGIQRGLESALKSGLLEKSEFESIWVDFERELSQLADRGVKKGEDLIYWMEGARVRVVALTADGDLLLDFSREGPQWERGFKGSYFARKSRFRKPLIRSLFAAQG